MDMIVMSFFFRVLSFFVVLWFLQKLFQILWQSFLLYQVKKHAQKNHHYRSNQKPYQSPFHRSSHQKNTSNQYEEIIEVEYRHVSTKDDSSNL
jgi:hypothetical protein